ncbi:MAG: glycosyltransferase family 39 protein [Planctomycetota bacterium]
MADLERLTSASSGVAARTAGWKANGLLAIATFACLLPFIGKAVHMDDPLFLWTARQIRKSPFDFYGFNVNWYGSPEPMSGVMKNPPLHAYLLAGVNELVDGDERGLHAILLLAAVASILGTHAVAGRMCANPLVAAFATLLTPAFLISSTNLMCDTTLVAFWVWSIYFWLTGIRQGSWALSSSRHY